MYYLYPKFCKIFLGWENRGKKKDKEKSKKHQTKANKRGKFRCTHVLNSKCKIK